MSSTVTKKKLFQITEKELYKSILYRAADIYEVEFDDVERDVGDNFDPIVKFMAGAMASELEAVYAHINDTDRRIQERLTKVLLPEYFHLPQPAHGLVKANSSSDSFVSDELTQFIVEGDEDDKKDIAFTPLFPTRILPAEIKLIATEKRVINVSSKTRVKRNAPTEMENIQRMAFGIETKEDISNWQGVTLHFDLKGSDLNKGEKTLFLSTMANGVFALHGQHMNTRKGLPQNEKILEDYLNGNERLQSHVRARYNQHFITFTDSEVGEIKPIMPEAFLDKWFSSVAGEDEELNPLLTEVNIENHKAMIWLEVHLPKPIELNQVAARLSVNFNVFPVVNRRLNGDQKGDHHYLRNNSIKWVSLQPKEDFLSIRKVYEESPPDYPLFTFKPFAQFKEERKPSYTLRHGGVGRWDDFNAWHRLAYVVNILQDNYKHKELVEEAAASLSLEEVHHLLGKRISGTEKIETPTKNIYVLLHSGISSEMRVRVEYWTSIGDLANNISAKTRLKCISKDKSNFDSESIEFLTKSSDGKAPLNSTQQLNAMKSVLLSRDRIVTREDVKAFCLEFLDGKISEVQVKDGVGTDPRFDFGMTRLLEVNLKPTNISINDDWQGICQQVQRLLEDKSTSSIPIRVQLLKKMDK